MLLASTAKNSVNRKYVTKYNTQASLVFVLRSDLIHLIPVVISVLSKLDDDVTIFCLGPQAH